MNVNFLPSSHGDPALQLATSLVVNGTLAIDAGCLGFAPLEIQRAVEHVVLTHAHADHIASLPMFTDTMLSAGRGPIRVLGSAAVLDVIRSHLFNDHLWPDLERLSTPERPLVEFSELLPEEPTEVGSLTLTAVPVDHTVPTCGYIVSEPGRSIVVATDSGPTSRLWELAAKTPDLAAVFIEASFPDSQAEFAAMSGHLTPASMADQLDQLGRPVRAIAVHLKAASREIVVSEIEALNRDDVEIGMPGTGYEF